MRRRIRISVILTNLKVDIEDKRPLHQILSQEYGIKNIKGFEIERESIDARKGKVKIVYSLMIEADAKSMDRLVLKGTANYARPKIPLAPLKGSETLKFRPLIVGSGPAGMFAGLLLAEMGYRPLILERGSKVEKRAIKVSSMLKESILDPDDNIQFGEGGAGTFSDGKLTSRIKKDEYYNYFISKLIENGAPKEIFYKSKPHLGTDNLIKIVKSIRGRIESLGGEYSFNEKLLRVDNRSNDEVVLITSKREILTNVLLLAVGHSARDTAYALYDCGLMFEQKAFAVGFRIEHSREHIDRIQYGDYAGNTKLKSAEYHLTYQDSTSGRGVYSFCMCPGGVVVPATSEANGVVTNGMSEFSRDKSNSNAALVVTVDRRDYGDGIFSGLEYQRKLEEMAFKLGGGAYFAPVQSLGGFMGGKGDLSVEPTYRPGVKEVDLRRILGDELTQTLQRGVKSFDRSMKGYLDFGAVLTGVETRTSSPIRMPRDSSYESNIKGIYPIGEGAGYAGGIVSAAIDGLRAASKVIGKYKPID